MAKRVLQEQGKFIGSKPAFGYQRDPDDKHRLIINEEEAVIVREIFERVSNGETTSQICKDLNQREINSYIWSVSRICTLLKKEIYKGILVQHQTETALYKNENFHKISDEEKIRCDGVVPAIVSSTLWQKAHDVIAERKIKKHEGIPENPYKNLVFCGKCGKKVSCSFKRKYGKFDFNCERCRNCVFSSMDNMNIMVLNHLKLSENTKITKELLNRKFERIIIYDRKNISFIDRDGDSG